MINEGINSLWPTTVIKDTIKDQELLGNVINELFSMYDLENPPSDIRQENIFDTDSKIIQKFKDDVVIPAFSRYLKEVFKLDIKDYPGSSIRGWIAGYSKGYYMNTHNHSGSHISAVFYLLADNQADGGAIVFDDPRVNANRGYPQEIQPMFRSIEYQPNSGDLLVFPCFLYHWVTPYYDRFRLAIPVDFNLLLDD